MHAKSHDAPEPVLDLARLEKVRDAGGKTVARCPACAESGEDAFGEHLFIAPDGRWGCVKFPGDTGAEHRRRIFALAGTQQNRPLRKAVSNPATAAPSAPDARTLFDSLAAKCGRLVKRWPYLNAANETVLEVGRFEGADGRKTYRPVRHDPDGWRPGLPAGPLPLFNLPAILASNTAARVFVTEGEKCADALSALCLLSVTSQGGAGAASKTDWQPLAGRAVTILPDNDAPGVKYAADVAARLAALTPPAQVRIAALPGLVGLGEGADVADWLDARDATDPAALVKAIEDAAVKGATEAATGALVSAADWLTSEPPPPDYVLSGIFEVGDRVLLVAPSKCRKSFFALQLAASVAVGVPFLGVDVPTPRRVLFVTLENRAEWEWRRLRGICYAGRIAPDNLGTPCRLAFMCCRGLPVSVAEIGTAAAAFRAELVIIDPTYALTDSGDEMDQTARRDMLSAVARIASAGPAVILVSHDPKGQAGDRDTRDRGSGSNFVNRAVDATFALTPWGEARDPEADSLAVLSVLARNSPPRPDVTIRFHDGAFTVDMDRAPVKATSRNRTFAARPPHDDDTMKNAALRIVETKAVPALVFDTRLQKATATGEKAIRAARADLIEAGILRISRREPKPGGGCFIGTPQQVEALHQSWQTE